MSQLDYANNKIEQARQALLSEGAGFIEERDALLRYRSELEQEIEHVHSEIRDMASGFLPFAIAPQWSKRLKRRLRAEDSVQREQVARDVVQSAATYLTDYLASEEFFQKKASKLSREEWHTIIHEINHALVSNETHSEIEVRHPVSEQTRHLLYTWIQEATEQVPEKLNTLSTRLETLEHERSNLERALGRVPDDLVAKPLLDDFQRWSTERGGLEEKIDALDVDIHKLKIQLAENERAIRQTRHELAEAEGVDTRIQRAAKAQVILDDYLERITQVKIEELENTFIQYFNRLTHKKGLVQTIRIDPRDFTTALYGANQTLIPKSDLSAGEKQLYAMALLWALRTVSGRVLPIIMDTPMGRLDIDHRAALIENFFPHVAHQVILLSTDSEIDAGAYDHIRNSVSHAYRLEYDGTTGYTRVIEGYIGCPELEALS
jgi:DNA sulfur modification protein DndD